MAPPQSGETSSTSAICDSASQTEAKRVENLALAEASQPRCVVRGQIPRTQDKRTDLELLKQRIAHAIEPTGGRWIRSAAMTVTARMRNHEMSPLQHLLR
jgi:hypothetical protein